MWEGERGRIAGVDCAAESVIRASAVCVCVCVCVCVRFTVRRQGLLEKEDFKERMHRGSGPLVHFVRCNGFFFSGEKAPRRTAWGRGL